MDSLSEISSSHVSGKTLLSHKTLFFKFFIGDGISITLSSIMIFFFVISENGSAVSRHLIRGLEKISYGSFAIFNNSVAILLDCFFPIISRSGFKLSQPEEALP